MPIPYNRAMRTSILLLALALSAQIAFAAEQGTAPKATLYPERAECGINLLKIGARLQQFAAAHDGALPSKLSEAFEGAEPSELRHLLCPAAKPGVTIGGFYPSYAYVNITPGGRKIDADVEDILAFDIEPVHEDGRNVLLTTMRVVYMTEADFQKALIRQQAESEKAGKTMELVTQDLLPLADGDALPAGSDAASGGLSAFVASAHFKITIVILIAIGIVLLLLVLHSRKSPTARGRNDDA